MNINEDMLNYYFNYKVLTNEEKNYIKVNEDLIRYNNVYHSYDFYESKFSDGYQSIPAFDIIISTIVENSKNNNPLKEYNCRINK